VNDEMTVDRFHENDANLYQILMKSKENGMVRIHEGTQGPLSEAMEKDLPEVNHAVTVMNLEKEGMGITFANEENTFKTEGLFASDAFFDVFSFPLLRGSVNQVLQDKAAIVISENFALKLFGSVDKAINQELKYSFFGKEQSGKITGVFEDVPKKSTMKFNFVATKQKLIEDIWTNGKEWYNTGPQTYLLLKPNIDKTAFDKKIERFVDNYNKNNKFSLFTRQFSDAYLKGNYEDGVQTGGKITYVRLFSFIAILVLLIACINFMNLSTARVTKRFKEIGVKKTVGSTKKTLVVQFLSESIFLTFLSFLVAIVMILLLIPAFNHITEKELDLSLILQNIPALVLAALVTGLISGSYPAFYLSGFSPLATLKGTFKSQGSELLTRKGLVVFQFMASLVLIIAVLIINNQLEFALNKPIGYQKDHIVQFDLEGKAYENIPFLFDEIKKIDGVEEVGGLSQSIVREDGGSSTYGIYWPGKPEDAEIDFIIRDIDENLMQTLKIEMAEGSSFTQDLGSPESYLIFNEEAIRLMGLENPVGYKVNLWGEDKTILGVMKDFHTASIMEPISPVVFQYSPNNLLLGMVRIKPGSETKTLAKIKQFYTTYNPGYNFNFSFQDQVFNAQYFSEQRILTLSKYFAILAIFISCLGLFGLAAFNNQMRIKEIGVRKVLGSSVVGILKLLFLDFIKLVLLSIFIASPIAWYLMKGWLQQFAYRIDIGWAVFAFAGLLTILVASVTIGYQALRAAMVSPVKSLRTE
jgi:ABC-type antimicrobial peptide transport system permease subunit